MIAYLKGEVKAIGKRSLTLVVDHTGYQVAVPEYVLMRCKQGDELELHTYLSISGRDETMALFGFQSFDELEFFKQLISISGVGPRSALATLSVTKLDSLKKTIARGDPSLLQKVAGIGKKTAERIVVELRDKLEDIAGPIGGADGDLVGALENLGYKAPDIRQIISQLPDDLPDDSARLKAALKLLGV